MSINYRCLLNTQVSKPLNFTTLQDKVPIEEVFTLESPIGGYVEYHYVYIYPDPQRKLNDYRST